MNRFFPLVISILMIAACTRHETSLVVTRAQATETAVQVETVNVSSIADIYRASGTVRARQTASIASKITANILEARVQAGDYVQAGQVLLVLDRRDLEANLRRAEATRIEAETAVAETETAIASARASVELARATHKRFQDLLAQTSVSQQEFDESLARLKSAEAAVEMAVSKRRQAEARSSQVEAELAAARVTLGYATLTAPFAGLVLERKADPGSLATPGAPLLTLEREGHLRLEASIDESRLGLVRIGESVAVQIDGLNRTVSGRVGEIVPSVDPATRTLTAKIDLPGLPDLRTGMFGRAAFAAGSREAILVSQTAVLERGQIRSVHVVEGDTARLRFVTSARRGTTGARFSPGWRRGKSYRGAAVPARRWRSRFDSGDRQVNDRTRLRAAGRLAAAFIGSKLTPLFVIASILLGVFASGEVPPRRGASDHRPHDRHLRRNARRFRARGGRARHQADGEAPVGDSGRRVHLLHFEPRPVHGGGALLRRRGRRESHRAAEPEDVRQLRPDPAGRVGAAHQAAFDR